MHTFRHIKKWFIYVLGKSSLVRVWTTVFTTVTPKGNCQNVDYDDDDHNETNGCCIPGGDELEKENVYFSFEVRHLRQRTKLLVLAARWSRTRRQEATSCNAIERERRKRSRVLSGILILNRTVS